MKVYLIGILFWILLIAAPLLAMKTGYFRTRRIPDLDKKASVLTVLIAGVTILGCTLPMGLAPLWNGENPGPRNQYEKMAEALLEGHLYIDYGGVDEKLLTMENPYDTEARRELGVFYHEDHAYYNGHYYMYFGVVPVLMFFLPYRLITGSDLTTYHATQVYAALIVIGFFLLFYQLAKTLYKEMKIGLYWIMSVSFSMISVWYFADAPALYCTAISSAVCMEVWSLYFFLLFLTAANSKRTLWLGLGSLCGALAFGCRPPVALANIVLLPVLYLYWKEKPFEKKDLRRLIIGLSPYVFVGIALMIYNYLRFDSVTDFGASYQLTYDDMTAYPKMRMEQGLRYILFEVFRNYFKLESQYKTFPFTGYNGIFINFNIFLVLITAFLDRKVSASIRKNRFFPVMVSLYLLLLVIPFLQFMFASGLGGRYNTDIYWICSILSFSAIIAYCKNSQNQKRTETVFFLWSYLMMIESTLMFFVPYDENYTYHFPEVLDKFQKYIVFWQ